MMTDDDRARLELAQRAWQIASASDQEVEAGVHRVNRRLRLRTHSRSHSRHVLTLVPAAFALFAALAYGQTGGFEHPPAFAIRWFGGQPGKSLETGLRPPAVDRAARGLGQDYIKHGTAAPEPSSATPVDPSELPTDSTAVEPDSSQVEEAVPAKPERKQRQRARKSAGENPRPSGEQTASGSWREIDQALADDNERAARRALQKLAKDERQDATTRAKARLGLAMLALSRDDCKRAAAIAEGVARTEGIDEKVVKRAHDIVLKCD
jgi:hypothetical protein